MFRSENLRRTGMGKASGHSSSRFNHLVCDDGGIRPSDTHDGVDTFSDARRTGTRHMSARKSLDDLNSVPVGRKHLIENHCDRTEAGRRINGKVGVRKFKGAVMESCGGAWSLEHDADPAANPPASPAPRHHFPVSFTAEQRALRDLEARATSDAVIRGGLAAAKEDGSVVRLHNNVKHRDRVQEFSQHRDPAAIIPMHKSKDLGADTLTNPPFATTKHDQAPHIRGQKRTFNTGAMSDTRAVEADRRAKMRQGVYRYAEDRPTPFDTAESGSLYPEPPGVGHTVPFNTRHLGKARPETSCSVADLDTISMQRARAKAHPAAFSASGMPEFIFSSRQPPIPVPDAAGCLRHAQEAHCTAINEQPVVRGRAKNEAAYRPTTLW